MLADVGKGCLETDTANEDLLRRLRSANGHLKAVISMAEANEPCELILHQLYAVEAALQCARHALIQCQVEECVDALLDDVCLENQDKTLSRLSDLYSLLNKIRSHG